MHIPLGTSILSHLLFGGLIYSKITLITPILSSYLDCIEIAQKSEISEHFYIDYFHNHRTLFRWRITDDMHSDARYNIKCLI